MTIRKFLFSSMFIVACGGSSKPAADTTTPVPPAEPPVAAEPAAAPAPPPPNLVLGDAKIAMKAETKAKGKSPKETIDAEIVIAADGTLTATIKTTAGKKQDTKTKTGKLTADGELFDDNNEVVAKVGADGTVSARQVREEIRDGKTVKSESTFEDVGTFDAAGVFTSKKDGKTLGIDDNGKLTGFLPPEMAFTVTAAPELHKAAVFVIISMFAASKITMESSGGTAPAAVPAAAPKKK